jgi:outer membrane protein
MKRLLLLLFLALPLTAQQFEAGIRHVAALSGETSFDGGRLEVPLGRGFAATAEVFWTESLATHVAATFVNPEAILYVPNDVDLGTLGMDIVTAEARWHVRPRARFSPYAGAGAAYAIFGNLEERFGDDIEADLGPEFTFVAEAGVRYRPMGRVAVELGVSYLPLQPSLDVKRTDVTLPAKLDLDPLIVSIGATWRF